LFNSKLNGRKLGLIQYPFNERIIEFSGLENRMWIIFQLQKMLFRLSAISIGSLLLVIASVSQSEDRGLIPSSNQTKRLETSVSTVSLLDTQNKRDVTASLGTTIGFC